MSAAKSYKPAHGGYPDQRAKWPSPAVVIVNRVSSPRPHGFGLGALHEAYDLGRRSR